MDDLELEELENEEKPITPRTKYGVREDYKELIDDLIKQGYDEKSLKDYFKTQKQSGALDNNDYDLILNLISTRFKYMKQKEQGEVESENDRELDKKEEQEKELAKKLFNADF